MMASDGGGGGALDGEEGWGIRKAAQPQLQLVEATTITTTTIATGPGDVGRGGYGGSSYGGGGGGGKSRANRLKSGKKGLPYERPSVGRSAAAGPQAAAILSAASTRALAGKAHGAKAWLGSGFSKIISTGATYLYSSIFRRNNPALPALPAPLPVLDVEVQQSDEDEPISSPTVYHDNNQGVNEQNGITERHNHVESKVVNSSNSDVEKLLAKRALSRDEFQRLTELLQSRVVSNGVEKKQQSKHVEFDIRSGRQDVLPSGGYQSEAQRWRQDLQKSREERENAVRTLTVYDNGGPSAATPVGVPESLDALSSSPVEVAIAFMGGRGSRLGESLSTEPLNQRDENRMSSGPSPSLNTPQTSLAKWTAPDFVNGDQFSTPPPPTFQSWGRHRTISRTPYSRPLRLPPSRERAIDGTFGTPSATRWTPIRTPVTGGREMLKRRSTVLDEGWTSGGPIRRTRHKAVVSASPSNLSQSRGFAFPATPLPSSSPLSLPSSIGAKRSEVTPPSRNASPSATRETNALTSSGNFYVPAQSSATARKILEALEKMTPPKGKSLGDELAYVRERPPSALTEGMLNDQARKSMTFVDYTSPSDSREPGTSGRTSEEEESLSMGYPGSSLKMFDSSTKVKGKGKGPLPSTENGPSGLGGSQAVQERTTTADGSVKQPSVRPKEPVTVTATGNNKGKGFRMNAVFEESGSEDEGRKSNSPPSMSVPKLPTTAIMPSVFGAATSSPTTTSGAGLPSFSASIPVVDTSKVFSSGFSFPTRPSLEGPPTPKAMSPASTSPKATSGTPFFQFADTVQPPAASGSTAEASSTPVKAESQPETKTEFSFGSPAPVANAAHAVSLSQPTLDFANNLFKQNSPPLKALPSAFAPAVFPTFSTGVGTNISAAPTSSKLGDILSAPASGTSFKVAEIPTSAAPFGQLFTSSSSSAQSPSLTAPSTNLFSSNSGSGTSPAPNLFASGFKTGTSVAPAFGQSNSFPFRNTSSTSGPLVSPDTKTSGNTDNSTPLPDPERPQKRSAPPSFQQDLSNRQPPSHIFTTFGASLATSAATPAIPVTFGAGGQTSSASQGLFSGPSFGQAASSASQTASVLPSAIGNPGFTFGPPATSAGTTSSPSSSAGFGSTAAFSSFSSSVFGTVSSGSTFGLTPAPAPVAAPVSVPAPLAFGSTTTTPAFGSASANSVFGGFAPETVSQSSPTPVFGSGFTLPSPSTSSAFSFGASSPAFSFGPSAAGSSGSAFAFGSAGSFPFAANKSAPPSPVFGLSSSVPAFGSTTNGTMANDVVVNEQSNMDDNSMAEEPSQMGGTGSPQPSVFGAQSNAGAGSFVFGAQAGAPGATGQPLFGGFANPTNPAGFPANPFAGSLDFAGGSFTLGSGGDNRPQRKMFKAKRTGAKRGK